MQQYSEDALVEQPAIQLFRELGWDAINCMLEGHLGPQAHLSGRNTLSEIVLVERLRQALDHLNPTLPSAAIEATITELTRDISLLSPARANQAMYGLIRDGVRVTYPGKEGEQQTDIVHVIDWDDPYNNVFLIASQLWISGDYGRKRPDLIGFVNGLPLVFIELKASHVKLENGYNKNLKDYRDTIPHVFWHNGFIIVSNGSETRVGSTTAGWEHFAEWKKINSEGEEGVVSLETVIRGTCEPTRLLDIIENFTLFSEERGGLIKIVAKNHQYLGVNSAIDAAKSLQENQGRLGVFWHTQGAGKSYSMIFFGQKILRQIPGHWTFVIVTDRVELDEQIYGNFTNAGAVTEPEESVRADSADHLRQLLGEDHRYVFTLIQKFRTERGERHPVISDRDDIIVITDEAHRSQYDIFAQNMREALPNAAFIGFTGTPLMAGEEKTRQVFGDYVSVYNFKQSVEDGSTVPLWYENRIPELQLINESFNKDMEILLDDVLLDEAREERLEHEFNREYHLITREDRLDTIAEDIVSHFIGRGFLGKGMVICVDKSTAVRMYDKVQQYWQMKIAELIRAETEADNDIDRKLLQDTLAFMQTTDMAVVISQAQGEIEEFAAKGLDIRPHRERMVREQLDEKFKDPKDPFRLVFVCAMWMTGFDAKACSTIYLDKPMRNHTLMQTIARANRVWSDKQNGLIVDYIGVFRDLQKALAIYGSPFGGPSLEEDPPIRDKSQLIEELQSTIEDTVVFCEGMGIDIAALQEATSFEFIRLSDEAVETLLINEDIKQDYLALSRLVDKLYKAILPDKAASEFGQLRAIFTVLSRKIQSLREPVDISDIMDAVEILLDQSVGAEGYIIAETAEDSLIDLSRIDFEALRERFRIGRKRTEMEKIRGTLNRKLQEMIALNKTRVDYQDRLERLIDEYNTGSRNIDSLFDELVRMAKDLSEEEQRHVLEQLTEEELALFDLLTKPAMDLTKQERERVKTIARDLIKTLKDEKLVLDWRKRQQTRAAVQQSIELMLDQLPDKYNQAIYLRKCNEVYQHVYDSYYDDGRSAYALAS